MFQNKYNWTWPYICSLENLSLILFPGMSLHLRRMSFLHFCRFLFTSVAPTFQPTHITPQQTRCAVIPPASHRRSYRFARVAICVYGCRKCGTACVFHLTHPWNNNILVVPLTNSCWPGLTLRRSIKLPPVLQISPFVLGHLCSSARKDSILKKEACSILSGELMKIDLSMPWDSGSVRWVNFTMLC